MCNISLFCNTLEAIVKKISYLLYVMCAFVQMMLGSLIAMQTPIAISKSNAQAKVGRRADTSFGVSVVQAAQAAAQAEVGRHADTVFGVPAIQVESFKEGQCEEQKQPVGEIMIAAFGQGDLIVKVDGREPIQFEFIEEMIAFIIEHHCYKIGTADNVRNVINTRKLTFEKLNGIDIWDIFDCFIQMIGRTAFLRVEILRMYACKDINILLPISNEMSPRLSELDCSWSTMTEDSLIALVSNLQNLQKLILCDCRQLTDRGLAAIAQHCRRLQLLDLAWCTKITDAGFISITNTCRDIRTLNLMGCELITDVGLGTLSQCERLIWLSIYGCNNITDKGVMALFGYEKIKELQYNPLPDNSCYCRNLTTLICTNCVRLTDVFFNVVAPRFVRNLHN